MVHPSISWPINRVVGCTMVHPYDIYIGNALKTYCR